MAAVPSIGRAARVEGGLAPEADLTRALYEQYANQIFRYCLHQLGSREEAEDAVQSTFLNAFRGIKRGIVPELESAWLFKIAHNVCLSRRRTSWRRGRIESPTDFDVVEELTPAPSRRSDELIGLQDVLGRLPENQRRAILLREWQGLSYREIAEELELSQAAVETLIFRARRALASGLEQPPAGKRRVARGADLGNVLAGLKSLLLGGGAAVKVAATVAVVSASTVVAAAPIQQHRPHAHPAPKATTPATAPSSAAPARGTAGPSVSGPVAFAPPRGTAQTHVRRDVRALVPAAVRPVSTPASESPAVVAPQDAAPTAPAASEPAPADPAPPPAPEPAAAPSTPSSGSGDTKKDAAPVQTGSTGGTSGGGTSGGGTAGTAGGTKTTTGGATGTTGGSTGTGTGSSGSGTSGSSGSGTSSSSGGTTSTPVMPVTGNTPVVQGTKTPLVVPTVIPLAPNTAAQYPTTQPAGSSGSTGSSGSSSSGSSSGSSGGTSQGSTGTPTTPVVTTPPAAATPAPVVAPRGTTTNGPVVSNPGLTISGGSTTTGKLRDTSSTGSSG